MVTERSYSSNICWTSLLPIYWTHKWFTMVMLLLTHLDKSFPLQEAPVKQWVTSLSHHSTYIYHVKSSSSTWTQMFKCLLSQRNYSRSGSLRLVGLPPIQCKYILLCSVYVPTLCYKTLSYINKNSLPTWSKPVAWIIFLHCSEQLTVDYITHLYIVVCTEKSKKKSKNIQKKTYQSKL